MKAMLGNAHFWAILAMLVAVSIFHYAEQLGLAGTESPSLHFGLTRHAVDRILFLFPIVYAGYIFRLRAGLATCFVVLLVILPRAVLISPNPWDAVVESVAIVVIGGLVCFSLEVRVRMKEQRQAATVEMETMQQELQSYIRLSRSNEKRLATINAISNMLSHSLELERVLSEGLDMVMDVLDAEVALVFSLDEKAQELRLLAYEGVSERFAQNISQLKLGEGFNGQVALTGEPLVVEDASHDPRLTRQMVREERIGPQCIVPLKARGLVVGTLCVANRRPRKFLPEEIELLSAIGGQIGITIENAQLYREQQRIAKEYRSIFENANDAIWVHDLEGNILTANEATARLTGYSVDDLVHTHATRFLTEEGLDLAREVRRKLLRGEVIDEPYEQRLVKKDGTQALIKLTSSLVLSEGQPIAFQHIARDVTEEQRMHENLRFYIKEITRAQEAERKRIARELHDETAQQLVALSHQLENLAHNSKNLSADDIELLENLRKQVRDALQGIRWFSRDLRPPILDDLGLVAALEWLSNDLEEQFGIKANLKVIGVPRRLGPEAELLIFRIVQEAVNNARRHAEASRVEVTIAFNEGRTMASIQDNGKGFELPERVGDLSRIGKLGLIGMEERARLLGGSLTMKSEPGKGTTVVVEAPI